MIYTDDHIPSHVHVFHGGEEIVINLGSETQRPVVRENIGMSRQHERQALRIVAEHQQLLLEKWREIHG